MFNMERKPPTHPPPVQHGDITVTWNKDRKDVSVLWRILSVSDITFSPT